MTGYPDVLCLQRVYICGKKQEASAHISGERPTLLACLQELRKRLEEHHGNCPQVLTEKDAADTEHTMTGKITSPILLAQNLRATFCTNEWLMEHVDSRINEMVVMYQSAEQVMRPPAPSDVSVCKGIMSCFSFLFLGVPRHYVERPFSCWYKACSRV